MLILISKQQNFRRHFRATIYQKQKKMNNKGPLRENRVEERGRELSSIPSSPSSPSSYGFSITGKYKETYHSQRCCFFKSILGNNGLTSDKQSHSLLQTREPLICSWVHYNSQGRTLYSFL